MIDPKEREDIINEAVEKALLLLPEVVSNLFMQKISMKKMAEEFYGKEGNEQFAKHPDIVQSVLEQLDSENPGTQYSELLKKAEPVIKQRIATLSSLDMKNADKPKDLTYQDRKSDYGKL